MLDLIAKQYKLSEEIKLLISDYLIGSIDYYKKIQLKINKNIIDINHLSIYIENNNKYNEIKKYINKLKYYIIDYDIIRFRIVVTYRGDISIFITIDFTNYNNNDHIKDIGKYIETIITNKIGKRRFVRMNLYEYNDQIFKVYFMTES